MRRSSRHTTHRFGRFHHEHDHACCFLELNQFFGNKILKTNDLCLPTLPSCAAAAFSFFLWGSLFEKAYKVVALSEEEVEWLSAVWAWSIASGVSKGDVHQSLGQRRLLVSYLWRFPTSTSSCFALRSPDDRFTYDVWVSLVADTVSAFWVEVSIYVVNKKWDALEVDVNLLKADTMIGARGSAPALKRQLGTCSSKSSPCGVEIAPNWNPFFLNPKRSVSAPDFHGMHSNGSLVRVSNLSKAYCGWKILKNGHWGEGSLISNHFGWNRGCKSKIAPGSSGKIHGWS
jgi:hypothetical protein